MEIFGQKLFFPPNYLFLRRLPPRFEILVISRGGEKQGKTVFEIEIAGQRLALPSRIALVPGKKYELEKISDLEFRIVKEINPNKQEREAESKQENLPIEARTIATDLLSSTTIFSLSDAVILRLLEDAGRMIHEKQGKFSFDFSGEFDLRGIFHLHADGSYTLFISGLLADSTLASQLREMLCPLGIVAIQIVPEAVFERLASGAIDLKL